MPATIASPPLTARPLRCRSCGAERAAAPIAICENCLGPLDPVYEPGRALPDRATIAGRGPSLWRYKEWLPFDGDPVWSLDTRFTPLLEASALARRFGVARVWVKNDTVSHPSLSFKDRVVAAAINAAAAFGLDTIGCASTGNLANAVAAHAARAGLKAWIFIPDELEAGKVVGTSVYGARLVRVRGTYDDVNRLGAQVADRVRAGDPGDGRVGGGGERRRTRRRHPRPGRGRRRVRRDGGGGDHRGGPRPRPRRPVSAGRRTGFVHHRARLEDARGGERRARRGARH